MGTATRLTLDQFLALPETEPPSEFICGEVVQKPMPSPFHSLIVSGLVARLWNYLGRSAQAFVLTEPRHANRQEQRSFLPDIAVVVASRMPRDSRTLQRGPLEMAPDIAIEVLSPDDRPGRVAEKLAFYLRAGVPLVWVVDPIERSLAAHRPGRPSSFHQPPEVIDAAPVLREFQLDLAELFAVLDTAEGTPG